MNFGAQSQLKNISLFNEAKTGKNLQTIEMSERERCGSESVSRYKFCMLMVMEKLETESEEKEKSKLITDSDQVLGFPSSFVSPRLPSTFVRLPSLFPVLPCLMYDCTYLLNLPTCQNISQLFQEPNNLLINSWRNFTI